jgi:UDPglucose 6-dehydrogenase
MLLDNGASVKAFDPQAMPASKAKLPQLRLGQDPYDAALDSDALLLATEWNAFKSLDFARIKENMRGRVILDGRNIWDGAALQEMGFIYIGIGIPNPMD